jgi:ubiquitin carboxyl-terminal hydrolase 7
VFDKLSEDIVRDHRWLDDDLLGVDHVDRTTKKTGGERGVVIK